MAEPDVAASVSAALLSHPLVRDVELIGSRAEGRAVPLSDWDFTVRTDDFVAVATDLPGLTGNLEPLVQQWDRLSPHQCYMLIVSGSYRDARDRAEVLFGVAISRRLEREVLTVLLLG